MKTWFWYSIGAWLLWGFWGFFPKLATLHMPPRSVMVFQWLGSGIVVLFSLGLTRLDLTLEPRGIVFAMASGLTGFCGLYLFLKALEIGKASVVVPLTSLYPMAVLVLAMVFLHEKLTVLQGIGVVLALAAAVCFSL